jgi:phospholipid transport system substrate-binding protein
MRRALAALGLSLAVTGLGGHSWAGTPTDDLRRHTDRVLEILRDPTLDARSRRDAVRDVAALAFDVPETARRALGPHWKDRTLAERDEFVRVFRDLLERTYVARIDEYGGERLRYLSERVDGDSAAVRAVIVTRFHTEVPVESRLSRHGDRWLVYDVLIENVSLVASYRAQFDRVIRSESYDELVRRLRARVALLDERNARPGTGGR